MTQFSIARNSLLRKEGKIRCLRLLTFGRSNVRPHMGTWFALLTRRARQNPRLGFSSRSVLSFALLRLRSLRTSLPGLCPSGHYLQTLTALKILCISVTPFSIVRLSSLRKEGKIRSWIIASRLQAVRFILFSQNIRSLFSAFLRVSGFALTLRKIRYIINIIDIYFLMLKIYEIRLSVILTINKYSLVLQAILKSQILRNIKAETRLPIAFLKIN